MRNPKTLKTLSAIIKKYDVFILDQWGVMHDGKRGFKKAIKSVEILTKLKKELIIISNSSRRNDSTIKRLPKLGFNSKHFKEVMTSGELTWQNLYEKNKHLNKQNNKCYYICDIKNSDSKNYIKGLDKFKFVKSINEADFILGKTIKKNLNTSDFIPILLNALERNIPFICANPDFISIEGKIPNICMGTIAELYKSMGGEIIFFGKPQIDIYIESTSKIKKLNKSKILAIGDSIFHDIKGANSFGIDSVLITTGIHHLNFDKTNPKWTSPLNKYKKLDIMPTYLCPEFQV